MRSLIRLVERLMLLVLSLNQCPTSYSRMTSLRTSQTTIPTTMLCSGQSGNLASYRKSALLCNTQIIIKYLVLRTATSLVLWVLRILVQTTLPLIVILVTFVAPLSNVLEISNATLDCISRKKGHSIVVSHIVVAMVDMGFIEGISCWHIRGRCTMSRISAT